jgi:hypothetical protein
MAPMHVKHAREVPEYEINPDELDFTNSVELTKVTCSTYLLSPSGTYELMFVF